jgi:hypothetical protein
MAVYFPRHKHSFSEIKAKFKSDLAGAKKHQPQGLAFVTNQEVTLGERDDLSALAPGIDLEIYHMERIAALLDQPSMAALRQKFLGIDPGIVPLDIRLMVNGVGRFFTGGEDLREALLEQEDDEVRAGAERQRNVSPVERERQAMLAKMLNQEPPGEPPTVEEVEEFVTARKARVERDWTRIEDYIAGMAWPAVHFVVTNAAPSFLYDVKLVVTFVGAYGVARDYPGNFEDEKLLDPDYKKPWDALYGTMPAIDLAPPPDDYPIAWKNLDAGLQVRISLAELPPGEAFEWESEEYEDVVLVAPATATSVRVTWVAVARGHGTQFTGPDLEVDVEEVSFPDAVAEVVRRREE